MNIVQKIATVPLAATLLVGGGAVAGYATLAGAQTTTPTTTGATQQNMHRGMGHGFKGGMHQGVMGTVSAVNGNTITVTNQDGTSYTVDASGAIVSKVVTIPVSDIKVGDTIGAQGTVSGTSVTAKHIMDGVMPRPEAPATTNQ